VRGRVQTGLGGVGGTVRVAARDGGGDIDGDGAEDLTRGEGSVRDGDGGTARSCRRLRVTRAPDVGCGRDDQVLRKSVREAPTALRRELAGVRDRERQRRDTVDDGGRRAEGLVELRRDVEDADVVE